MKCYETYLIGHITFDELREDADGRRSFFYGGAELFSAYAARAAGGRVGLLTKLSAQHRPVLDLLPFDNEDICCLESPQTTSMLNWYASADRERRKLIVSSVAEPFSMKDLPPDIESEIYHLAGLMRGDFAEDMVEKLAARGRVAVDMQGFLRCRHPETKKLFFEDYPRKLQMLPHIAFLKTDAAEAEILTGFANREEAARQMCAWGAGEVMVTHGSEAIVCKNGRLWRCPLTPKTLRGRTGRGDTIFGAYVTERLKHGVYASLQFAAAAVSLKMEQPGPLKKTRKQICQYKNEAYGKEKRKEGWI